VILQTYFQDHYAVQYAAQHDFAGFYDKELRFRSWMHYPPYSALANVLIRSNQLDEALLWSARWENGLNRRDMKESVCLAQPPRRLCA